MEKHTKLYTQNEVELNIQIMFNDKHLIPIRKRLGPKTLNKFLIEYSEANSLRPEKDYEKTSEGEYIFNSGRSAKCIVSKNFTCTCLHSQYMGLPCCHILKALKEEKKEYIQTVHKRWLIGQRKEKVKEKTDEPSVAKRPSNTRSGGAVNGRSMKKPTSDKTVENDKKVKEEHS